MGNRGLTGLGGPADLEDDDLLAPGRGTSRQRFERAQVTESFHVQPENGDPVVFQERGPDFGHARPCLIAGRRDETDGKRPRLHGNVDRHVRRLGHDCDSPRYPSETVLVRPEECAVEGIYVPVAIGSQNRHVPGGGREFRLEVGAVGEFGFRLPEAGGETDGAAAAHGGQRPYGVDGRFAVHADECGVGCGRKAGKIGMDREPRQLRFAAMDRPEISLESEHDALFEHGSAPGAAAEYGD